MRKKISIILAFVCVIACAFAFSSCGAKCPTHTDVDFNGYCDSCGEEFVCPGHADANEDGTCDFCYAVYNCPGHVDVDANGKCDKCNANFTCPGHADVDANGRCDVCDTRFSCSEHADVNMDGKCDNCKAVYVCPGHTDVDANGKCEVCGANYTCPGHVDANGDNKCDKCSAAYTCLGHIDSNSDSICDNCQASFTCPAHVDTDENQRCDICDAFYVAVIDYLPDFVMASKSTDPSKVVVTVNSKFGTDNLVSRFTIEYSDEDASFVINYYVESFNTDFMADEYKIVSEGTITCDAEGNYSDGGSFVGSNPAATGVKADLNKLKNYVTSETTLTATVAKADTASVFGTAYGSDVTLVVTKNSSSIVSVSLAYRDVQILCVYN